MNKEDEKRLDELLGEVLKIFSTDEPMAYGAIIKDINRELSEIAIRNNIPVKQKFKTEDL